MNIFGQKLRKLREDKGLTQQQLAEKLGYAIAMQ
jgi:transcriptional regulator with XRE-family HTH domain